MSLNKIIQEILNERWGKSDFFSMVTSSQPKIPINPRINDYDQVALQKKFVGFQKPEKTFPYSVSSDSDIHKEYSFESFLENDDRENSEFIVDVLFNKLKTEEGESWEITTQTAVGNHTFLANKGKLYKIFPTLFSIIIDFINEKNPDVLLYKGTQDGEQHTINVAFFEYLQNHINEDYKILMEENVIRIINKKFINTYKQYKKLASSQQQRGNKPESNAIGY